MKNKTHSFKTKNLLLCTFEEKDARNLQVLLSVNKQYMIPWIPWAKNEPESVEVKKKKIREWNDEFTQNKKYVYGVYKKSTDELIGISFLFTRRGKNTLEIGYIIDFREYGKGYATEVSAALTQLGFEIGAERIFIYCDRENKASVRIPEKLGYKHTRTENENQDGSQKTMMAWEKINPRTNQSG